jgi:hypothetical protein
MNDDKLVFEPIRIRYDGIDAEGHQIDLAELGKSAMGLSKILATVADVAISNNYQKRRKPNFRVLVGGAEDNCITFQTIIQSISPNDLATAALAFAGVAIWDIFKGVMKLFWKLVAGKPKEETREYQDLLTLLKQSKEADARRIDKLIATIEVMADGLRTAAIQATNPISISCNTLQIGDVNNDYFVKLDSEDREAIRTRAFEFSDLETSRVLISEIDVQNATCMISTIDDLSIRTKGTIVDPQIEVPNNPYGLAVSSMQMVTIVAKRKIYKHETKEFIISNIQSDAHQIVAARSETNDLFENEPTPKRRKSGFEVNAKDEIDR